jgi:hypothetical protein
LTTSPAGPKPPTPFYGKQQPGNHAAGICRSSRQRIATG